MLRYALACLIAAAASTAADERPRVLVVTGGHELELSFFEMFSAERAFDYTLNGHPRAFRPNMVKRHDVLVLYDLADVNDEAERKSLRQFLEAGKGMVVLHHALADNQQWPWWSEEVVGGRYLLKPEGARPGSKFKHDVTFDVKPVGKHPILDGVGPFRILDEGYKDMWISPKVQVLLETVNEHNDKPMAWVSPYQASRVAYIQLGHGADAHRNPEYRKLVRNAILWAAGKK